MSHRDLLSQTAPLDPFNLLLLRYGVGGPRVYDRRLRWRAVREEKKRENQGIGGDPSFHNGYWFLGLGGWEEGGPVHSFGAGGSRV